MDKNEDLRVIRSRRLIEDAFFTLVEEEGIEAVTVRKLTAQAGINRGTFYLHYQDIYDLMEKMEDRIMEQMKQLPVKSGPQEMLSAEMKGEPFPSIAQFIDFMNEEHRFFQVFFAQEGALFGKRLRVLIQDSIVDKIPKPLLTSEPLPVPADYIVAYFSSAHFGVIKHWFNTGRALPPYDLAVTLTRLIKDGPLLTALNQQPANRLSES
ncbi:TetR/AcrR family transcriptional regulator [Paenibacillus albidus]|nr:TetR/AcrR family transcriptional regulator [Paenibacillus albidus]